MTYTLQSRMTPVPAQQIIKQPSRSDAVLRIEILLSVNSKSNFFTTKTLIEVS